MNIAVERLKQLPLRADQMLVGGLVRLPMWTGEKRPYRPWAPLWINPRTGTLWPEGLKGTQKKKEPTAALQALLDLAADPKHGGFRPGFLEVEDPETAELLRAELEHTGVQVTLRNPHPALRRLMRHLAQSIYQQELPPDALDVPGVTLERMRAFADAAKQFYRKEPWWLFPNNELVQIAAPEMPAPFRCASVMGGGGITFGVAFFESVAQFKRLNNAPDPEQVLEELTAWSVMYGPIYELPLGDADLWTDQKLPVAGPEAYPMLAGATGGELTQRPDPQALALVEGLLRALAETKEAEVDQGEWKKEAVTFDGAKVYELAMVD